jgi:DNA-binding SARP family transcriptional activator/ATP/maltotriose-dependent transcriptional regulator MalT
VGDLPAHHVPRPRLTAAADAARVVVIEAGAGYGKSTLATELVGMWGAVEVEVALNEGGGSAALLATRLRAALGRSGYSDSAAAMADAGYDPHGAVDAAIAVLADEACVIVIDDAQHADREAAALIGRLASRISAPQRAIVLARRLPEGAERLRRAEFLQFGPADLELGPSETVKVCRAGFGLNVTEADAAALCRSTGGWTAATVLAAARARRTGESLAAVTEAAKESGARSAVEAILAEAVSALAEADIATLAQIARVGDLDRSGIDLLADEPGFLDRVLSAGVPLTAVGDGQFALPGPVRDFFSRHATADPIRLRRLADQLMVGDDLSGAVQLLLAVDDNSGAADLVDGASPAQLDPIDLLEFEAMVDRLDSALVERHPRILLHLSRLQDGAGQFDRRSETLDRLDRMTGRFDERLRRTVAMERTIDRLRVSEFADVEGAAAHFLAEDDGADPVIRARALSGLARAVCWRTDPNGERDEAAVRRSAGYFDQAAALYRAVGLHTAAAAMVPYRAMWIDYALGDAQTALRRLDAGVAEVAKRPRKWSYLMSFRCEVLVELGRYDEATAANDQSIEVGDRYDDDQLRAFGYWNRAIIASHLGDADQVLEQVRLAERHRGEWFAPLAGDFFGSVADELDRVGHSALAWDYLERAQADPKDGEAVIGMAEAALLARHGDPERAETCLQQVFTHRVDPRERWRVTLLRAYAAFRRGEPRAGALAARAFEQAAGMGLASLPLTKERDITRALLGLAVETGQPAALALEQTALPATVTVLGQFALTRGGRPVEIAPGQSTQLLKLLAVSRGPQRTERVIDELWAEVDLDTGRNRLRTVLNRLRREAGDVVERDGDRLSLSADISIDLDRFEDEARQALALGAEEPVLAASVARSALARYRGDVLPDDLYEPWAERARDRARRRALDLLDLCADFAADVGDLDEVRRLVERTIDLAPYDDERYLRAATALLEQGRRGAALAVMARARAALAEIGLPPPLDLVRLEREVVA